MFWLWTSWLIKASKGDYRRTRNPSAARLPIPIQRNTAFFADWRVKPENNLCTGSGNDKDQGKVDAFIRFMRGNDKFWSAPMQLSALLSTNSQMLGAFNDTLVAIDEFHHVSAEETTVWAQSWTKSCATPRLILSP